MRVFISWSGPTSNKVAMALKDWLPCVIQSLEPWVSTADIDKGRRWSAALGEELDKCRFAILCMTPDNLSSEWLHFEAGAIAKTLPEALEAGRVTPFLVGVPASALRGALGQFQATDASEDDVWRLMTSLNGLYALKLGVVVW